MKKKYIVAANWKMYLSFNEVLQFAKDHSDSLVEKIKNKNLELVIFPPYLTLPTMNTVFNSTPISIGAQNCSSQLKGSFTGQVSAQCLHQSGCKYCLVGHSEARKHLKESDLDITQKIIHLIDFDISPILCIGETDQEYQDGKTTQVLERQLSGILRAIQAISVPEYLEICIAYEPVWSIGSNKVADKDYLEMAFAYIKKKLILASRTKCKLLYGGSVNQNNIKPLREIKDIEGFLIGRASIDFEELNGIINGLNEE